MNPHVPEEYGGLGLHSFEGMLIGEELSWGCSGIAVSIVANTLGVTPILIAGTEEQRREWLPPLLDEPILCSFGLTEPDAGSDVARIKTTAERRGDEYVLNGSKMFITNAGHAAWTIVFAKTDKSSGHKGLSAFIVPMDAPGVTIEKHLDKMGQRATDTSAFAMNDVSIPAANLLGEEGDGFKIAMQTLDFTRPGTAAGAVGVAQAAYDYSEGVRSRAGDVRRADRNAPGRQLPDRRHGDGDRGGAAAHVAGRVDARQRLRRRATLYSDGKAIRGRHGDEGGHRRGADLRRLRLHQGVPGREADA